MEMVVDLAKLTMAIDAVTDKPAPASVDQLESRLKELSAKELKNLRETIISSGKADLQLNGKNLTVQVR